MDESQILKEFTDLQSEVRRDKIALELDPVVSQFVNQLFDSGGWACYSLIARSLTEGSLIYYSIERLDDEKLVELIDRSFREGSGFFADLLSKYLRQARSRDAGESSPPLELFQNFVDQGALRLLDECLEYCSVCNELKIIQSTRKVDVCPNCQTKLFHVMQASVPESVRSCISNGQFLEIYTLKCLRRSGFTLISKRINGDEVSTSIPYRAYGADVEVDVGAVRNSSLVLFECKTGKLVPNDVSEKLGQFKLLINTLRKRLGGLPDLHLRFVVLGEIDDHIELKGFESAYAEDLNLKSLDTLSREEIPGLPDYLKRLCSKL